MTLTSFNDLKTKCKNIEHGNHFALCVVCWSHVRAYLVRRTEKKKKKKK